jgi:predicted metal-dependent hydrolase
MARPRSRPASLSAAVTPSLFDELPEAPDLGRPTSSNTVNPPAEADPHANPAPTEVASQPALEPFSIEVRRSARRKRTVGAELIGDVLKVVVPSWMTPAEEAHWVDVMSGRFKRRLSTDCIDLSERALSLSRRHDLRTPLEIRWSDDMHTRWGSCTPATGTIRISSRLARFPDWVLDYVIVHELAHLQVFDHSPAFWQIVHRFRKAERAIGYLMAKSGEEHE